MFHRLGEFFRQADKSSPRLYLGALAFFLVGATLTTVFPVLVEGSWGETVKGAVSLNDRQMRGREIYIREGCWYCHTQQVRTLEPDTKRFGWRGVDAPISRPQEYADDRPHLLGTRRIGPDLSRIGGKYDRSWHLTHFRNPADLVPGSVMPPFPWLLEEEGGREFDELLSYMQTLGRSLDWRPDDDYEGEDIKE